MMPGPPMAAPSTTSTQLPDGTFLSARSATPAASVATPAGSATTTVADVQGAPEIAPFTVALDDSSPEAFIRSIAPYAARVSKATGIPAEALIGMAANETGYGKYASHNNLFGIKGTGPAGTFSTPTWEDYGNGPVTIVDNFRAYHSPAESFMDFATLVTTSPRYHGAVGQTTVEGFVSGLRAGGYMTDPDYVSKISAITTRYNSVIEQSLQAAGASPSGASSASTGAMLSARASASASLPGVSASSGASAAGPSSGVVVPNQFAIGLPADEAMAACGPVAAIAFAQVYGRNPTPTEAMDLAKQSGWTAEGGMNGVYNEKRLLDKLNLPSQLEVPPSWTHIQSDALQHQPVILATPGHYFVIDGYDPSTGAYHVGQSGKVYRAGSDWMTPAQIEAVAGAPSGALYTVHPLAGQHQVLPPLDMSAVTPQSQAQVMPSQREVLPPLDLGNTPAPPPVTAPPPSAPPPADPPPEAASSTPPPADAPLNSALELAASPPPADAPSVSTPPDVLLAAPPSTPGEVAPPGVVAATSPDAGPPSPTAPAPATDAADSTDPPTLVMSPPAQDPQGLPQADTARPSLTPGLAVGAIAASSQAPVQPAPDVARRRAHDEDSADA